MFSGTIAVIIWLILRRFLGGQKSGLIISLLVVLWMAFAHLRLFFGDDDYKNIHFLGSNLVLIPIFTPVGLFGIIYIIKKKLSVKITSTINVMSIVIISFLVIQIIFYYINEDLQHSSLNEFVDIPITQSNVVNKPDVYVLVLDAYSGDITLQNDFGYDNSEFKSKLESKGFVITKKSFSNYPNTNLSLPSIMNMVYLDFLADELGKDSRDVRIIKKLLDNNNVMRIFNANGYWYFLANSKASLTFLVNWLVLIFKYLLRNCSALTSL